MLPNPSLHVGTASWTDPTLIASGAFYPPTTKTAQDRLRFYAEHFDTVEVDSTYYALPSERNAQLWAERTPANFVFHVKAFALLTTHPAETAPVAPGHQEIVDRSGVVQNETLPTERSRTQPGF